MYACPYAWMYIKARAAGEWIGFAANPPTAAPWKRLRTGATEHKPAAVLWCECCYVVSDYGVELSIWLQFLSLQKPIRVNKRRRSPHSVQYAYRIEGVLAKEGA